MNEFIWRHAPPSFIEGVKRIVGRVRARDMEYLARLYGSDKGAVNHKYTSVYLLHFASRRKNARKVLEVGIGGYADTRAGGASLKMWQAYFPRAMIVGIDLYRKDVTGPRIRAEVCDQSDPSDLAELAGRHGPFDIIIDDGSHIGRHTWLTFEHLFPAVVDGGLYVIEDLHTSYATEFEGGPPGTPNTAVELIGRLIDHLHLGTGIAQIDVHQGVAVVVKGKSKSRAADLTGEHGFFADYDPAWLV